jgi:hypothetical protein
VTVLTEVLPKKVLSTAHENGLHNDCVAAEQLCPECWEVVVRAIDSHYAHHGSPALAASAFIDDLLEEQK